MKKIIQLLILNCFIASFSNAQLNTIIEDNFTDMSKFIDISENFIWGTNSSVETAFELVPNKSDQNGLMYNAITLSDSGEKYATTWGSGTLWTANCLDYEFPGTFSRQAGDSLIIEFDAYWDEVDQGNGQRIVCAVNHVYPSGGPAFNDISNTIKEAPFGRPGYNFRVLSRDESRTGDNMANIFYGGGHSIEGEYEFSGGNDRWLPGFISGPGGITPENTDPDYPEGEIQKYQVVGLASTQDWIHFTLVITETRVEYYHRNSSESVDTLIDFMETPRVIADTNAMITQMNNAHGTSATKLPTLYNYFDNFKSVRLYFRGGKTYFANVKISSNQIISGVEDNVSSNLNNLSVYPIPADDILHVKNAGNNAYTLYNITGKAVLSGNIKGGNIDVSSLPAGIYMLEVDGSVVKLAVR